MRRKMRLAGLFLVASMLCSCASLSLVDTWRNPAVQAARLHKVLVVSIATKEASRGVYEDVLATELGQHGVAAVAAHTVIPGGVNTDRTVLDQAVKKVAADSVLTVQTIKVERQTTIDPGYVDTYPGHWYPEAFPTWDLYGYYGSMASYGPTYVSTYDIATIQVNLFDTTTGKLIWAATMKTSEPEKVISVAKDLARIVIEKLGKEGLI
jgi:hypothetical protein